MGAKLNLFKRLNLNLVRYVMDKKYFANNINLNLSDTLFDDADIILNSESTYNIPNSNEEFLSPSSNFISDEDIFGASVKTIDETQSSYWLDLLKNNKIFDANLAYSSHEIMHLEGDNLVYDDSEIESVIFVSDGYSEIYIGDKSSDVFLQPDSHAILRGEKSDLNIFIDPESSSSLTLEGSFTNLSINLFKDSSDEIIDFNFKDENLLYNNNEDGIINFNKFDYRNSTIEINIYDDDGLVSSEKMSVNGSEIEELEPAQVETAAAIYSYDNDLFFTEDLEIQMPESYQSLLDTPPSNGGISIEGEIDVNNYTNLLENQTESAFEEITTILEIGEVYNDLLDIIDDL